MPRKTELPAPVPDDLGRYIHTIRGNSVMLDEDLADLYAVKVKELNRAAKRNAERFPPEFRFQITAEEAGSLRFQFGTLDTTT